MVNIKNHVPISVMGTQNASKVAMRNRGAVSRTVHAELRVPPVVTVHMLLAGIFVQKMTETRSVIGERKLLPAKMTVSDKLVFVRQNASETVIAF